MKVREMDIEIYRNYMNALEASPEPAWRYDETRPCGATFNSAVVARAYDTYHGRFRDFSRGSEEIICLLKLSAGDTVIDMGCGTGAFAVHAAGRCAKVYAVDPSRAMLRRARKKAQQAGLANIEFHQGGFLTYRHDAEPVDAAVSSLPLHHLPDLWKLVALIRVAEMLKAGGRLYLRDVVFAFDAGEYESAIEEHIESMVDWIGPEMRHALEVHISKEYSTCGWIIEGLLDRAGFQIETADYRDDFMAAYLCTKVDRLQCVGEGHGHRAKAECSNAHRQRTSREPVPAIRICQGRRRKAPV